MTWIQLLLAAAPVVLAYVSQIALRNGWKLPGVGPVTPAPGGSATPPADPFADRPILAAVLKTLQQLAQGQQQLLQVQGGGFPIPPAPMPAPVMQESQAQEVESEVPFRLKVTTKILS